MVVYICIAYYIYIYYTLNHYTLTDWLAGGQRQEISSFLRDSAPCLQRLARAPAEDHIHHEARRVEVESGAIQGQYALDAVR